MDSPVWFPSYRNTGLEENMISYILVLMRCRLCFVLFRAVLTTCPERQDFWTFRRKVILAMGLVDWYGLGIDWFSTLWHSSRDLSCRRFLINITRPLISIQLNYQLHCVDARIRILYDTCLRLFTGAFKSWVIFGVVLQILQLTHWARYMSANLGIISFTYEQ